jgi:hypothetical protein
MSQRVYGPTQGAGTQITETDAEKTIVPSTFGVTVHVGAYQRGMVGALNFAPKKKQFSAQMGGRLANGLIAPDAALDFFDMSEGAGELWCVRVTDGNEVASSVYLYNRRVPRSAVVKFSAHDGGQWAGRAGFLVGEIEQTTVGTTTSTDLTETTLSTGKTMLKDYWAGAVLKLHAVATKSYLVLSNTVDGVLTVVSDTTMLTDYGSSVDLEYTLELADVAEPLEVYVHDGTQAPTEEWGADIYWNGALEQQYDNLSSDPTSPHYFVRAFNDDTGNFSVKVQDLWTGGYAADVRPANHYEQVASLSSTVAKLEIVQAKVNSVGGGTATIGGWSYGQKVKAQSLTITFTTPTAYGVVSDQYGSVGTGVVGAAFVPTFGADYIPSFVVTAGTFAMAALDTISVLVNPLTPDALVGGLIYPNKATDRRTFFVIVSNTVDTVTVKSDSDMTVVADAGTPGSVTGTATGPTFSTVGNTALALRIDGGPIQVVPIPSGATVAAANIVNSINSSLGMTIASYTTDKHIKLTSTIGGRFSAVWIGAGGANTPLGFTASTNHPGAVGDSAMLQWRQPLAGGYDGLASLTSSDYEAMYDLDTSPINRLFGRLKGLVKLGTPGVTSTALQKQAAAYAEARNYQYRYECPADIVTEDAAEEYVNDTLGRSDFAVMAFPSYAYIANPLKNSVGMKLVSTTGAIHGREAKMASAWSGYHKAAAGVDVTLPAFLSLPTGDAVLDEESLNPQGIQVLKFVGGNLIIWGDRTVSADPSWMWKHQREQMSHYGNVLRENFDWIIFAINDTVSWTMAWTELDKFFKQEVTNRALDGYNVKIDAENNTTDTKAKGNANCDIRLKFVDTIERFRIGMSKVGVFEDVGT